MAHVAEKVCLKKGRREKIKFPNKLGLHSLRTSLNFLLGSFILRLHHSCHCSLFDCPYSGLRTSHRFIDYRSVKQIDVCDVTYRHDKESDTIISQLSHRQRVIAVGTPAE
jgi:ABC-type histidine transport system ATPase subunit